jgi:uncharacterized membrane protein
MKKHFITGLVTILPIVLTIVILGFLLRLLTNPFEGIAFAILKYFNVFEKTLGIISSTKLTIYLSRVLILVVLISLTFLIGFIARWFFVHEVLKLSDWLFHRIPLVNKIYRASQETVTTLFSTDSRTFKQVVLVPFPQRPGLSIGLVTASSQAETSDERFKQLVSVFVPGTPNPTVGFLLLFRPEEIIPLDLSVEEAMKYIISCGVMLPSRKG